MKQTSTPRSRSSKSCSRPAPRLENTASQVTERFLAYFAARDWDAMTQILADIFSYDDRRRVVGSGVRHGRDAHIADMRASADLWTADVTPAVIATRGERLVLAHLRFPGRDQAARGICHRCAQHRRDQRRRADRGLRLIRPRRFRRRLRRTRCQVPRRRGSTISGRMVRHRCRLRRAQPVRGPAVGTGLREHRSPVTGDVRGGGSGRKPPRCLGSHSGTQGLYRGCASAQRPGSSRHPCRAWNHARRLRRRVARDPLFDARRRHGQPLRDLLRGRP